MTSSSIHRPNDLPIRLPVEKPTERCNCCPYGYHIDLDFVRYCESLADRTTPPSREQRVRRDRRRQRKSMEFMLGFGDLERINRSIEPPVPPKRHAQSTLLLRRQVPDPRLTDVAEDDCTKRDAYSAETTAFVRDALFEVCSDFERTLEETSKRTPSVDRISDSNCLPSHTNSPSETEPFAGRRPSIERCSEPVDDQEATALQTIRQQMAESLERMKDLEEMVKTIPKLERQLVDLEVEKRNLEGKLKRAELPNGPMIRYQARQLEKFHLPEVKSIINRDVGVNVTPPTRTIGTEVGTAWIEKQSIGTDPHIWPIDQRSIGTQNWPPKLCHNHSQTERKSVRNIGIETIDLKRRDSAPISLKSMDQERQGKQSIATQSIIVVTESIGSQTVAKGINQSIQVSPITGTKSIDTKSLINLNDRSTNTEIKDPLKSTFSQTHPPRRMINRSSQIRPETIDNFTATVEPIIIEKRDKETVTDLSELCSKCRERDRLVDSQLTDRQSRIPRPKGTSSPRTERKVQLMRQNTYTVPTATKEVELNVDRMSRSVTDDIQLNHSFGGGGKLNDFPQENHPLQQQPPKPIDIMVETFELNGCDGDEIELNNLPSNEDQPIALKSLLSPIDRKSESPPPNIVLKSETITTITTVVRNPSESKPRIDDHDDLEENEPYNEKLPEPFETRQQIGDAMLIKHMETSQIRDKAVPTVKMQSALKVLNDAFQKEMEPDHPSLTNARKIVRDEWFMVSSTDRANPTDVEDYLDHFELYSIAVLTFMVNLQDGNGNTCMHYAVSHGNFDIVSILLDAKVCNVNQVNNAGYTSVMLVSLAKLLIPEHHTVVRRLFHMSDVNVGAKRHSQTALMLAVSHDNFDMVQMLLEAGADINIQDDDGSTALMCAAEHGRIDIVKLLLAHPDCDSTIQDIDGSTALKISLEAGYRDIGVLLYAHEHMSRNRSPYTSFRRKRQGSMRSSPAHTPPVTPKPSKRVIDHSNESGQSDGS